MTSLKFTHGRIEIDYDLNGPPDQTVTSADVKIGGVTAGAFVQSALTSAGGQLGPALASIRAVFPEVWDAVSALETATPGTLTFRDTADRFHEALIGSFWTYLTGQNQDQLALGVALTGLGWAVEWETAKPGPPRYVHKGTLTFYAAVSSLRLRNVDDGMWFLEAGEETDRVTYDRAKQPGGTNRPGTLTLLLIPGPNALNNDVMALRQIVEGRLQDFNQFGGLPPGDPVRMDDFDRYFLRDPTNITGAKFIVAYLYWKAHTIDDPVKSRVPTRGKFSRRRRAEMLLGMLTAVEQVVRRVAGSGYAKAPYYEVVAAVALPDWQGRTLQSIEKALARVQKNHRDDLKRCFKFWQAPPTSGPAKGAPWYLRWVEPGRFLRNKVAHNLETPVPVDTMWVEADRVAWFALFSAVWLLRRKDKNRVPPGRAPVPTATPSGTGQPVPPQSGVVGIAPLVTNTSRSSLSWE